MPIHQVITEGRVPVKVWTDEIESGALQQLANIAQLPFVHKHVAAMPDAHTGIGATVGSVIATRKAIIPAGGWGNCCSWMPSAGPGWCSNT